MKAIHCKNDRGFILVWTLLLLIVVTLLGVAGVSTSIFEERMAANEALYRQAFYEADGGSENALALIVENVNCISGFEDEFLDGAIEIDGSLNFWQANYGLGEPDMPTEALRDFHYPTGYAQGDPYTHGKINADTELMVGANLPMLAGYEGKGKAIGQDGAFLEYQIKVEHNGERNNRGRVYTKFRLDNQFASYPASQCRF